MAKLTTLIGRLKKAAATDDPGSLTGACQDLVEQLHREPDTIAPELARKSLDVLRSSRRFEHMGRLAEAFIGDGCEDAQVQRQYAQALIENGQTMPAIRMLEGVVGDGATSKAEWAEAKGVLGRAWKERALAARGKRDRVAGQATRQAFRNYMDVYSKDPKALYQGINAVAVAFWDRGLALTGKERKAARQTAEAIVSRVKHTARSKRETWDLASAGEALIALGRREEAIDWFGEYAHRADAFALAGTVRQLTDLWKLDETEEGQNLIGPMRAHLLEKPGGQFAVSMEQVQQMASVDKASYEKVLGNIGPATFTWMQKGFRMAESVALIRQNGRGMGTGFLVRGSDLNPDLGDELFVLTNAHVVSDPPIGHAAHPSEVTVSFEAASAASGAAGADHDVREVVWQSPPDVHDASLLRLASDLRGAMEPLTFSTNLPRLNSSRKQRVYVIGHPGGGEISFSFQDNELLDYESDLVGREDDPTPCRVHYRTPTEPGSSGSPVFNGNWATIALHHAGSKHMERLNGETGTYPANEGIWIQSIRRARPG